MSKHPSPSLPPAEPVEQLPTHVQRLLAGGLGDLNLRELLALAVSSAAHSERSCYLRQHPQDKANGSYARSVWVGQVPLGVEVPRTREGTFRPFILPPPYQRGYQEEHQALLLGLLASSRSVQAAKAALLRMGVPLCGADLEQLAEELKNELELRNTRPLDPDLLALFLDAKYVEVREGDRLRPTTLYLAIGLQRDGRKRSLACLALPARENPDDWKKILSNLLERGLRRVLLVVQDDFPGLLKITQAFFPQADVQLCLVHLQRNAQAHLPKPLASDFRNRLRTIKTTWQPESASAQLEQLSQLVASAAPVFAAELRRKKDHYLAFLKYPEAMRRTFSTTNAVEAVNGQLERLRRNNGGYFHSENILKTKLGLAIRQLEEGKWRRVASNAECSLPQLNALFHNRFESNGG